jgi:hypothetical protein
LTRGGECLAIKALPRAALGLNQTQVQFTLAGVAPGASPSYACPSYAPPTHAILPRERGWPAGWPHGQLARLPMRGYSLPTLASLPMRGGRRLTVGLKNRRPLRIARDHWGFGQGANRVQTRAAL